MKKQFDNVNCADFAKLKALEASGRIGASGVVLRQRLENIGFAA